MFTTIVHNGYTKTPGEKIQTFAGWIWNKNILIFREIDIFLFLIEARQSTRSRKQTLYYAVCAHAKYMSIEKLLTQYEGSHSLSCQLCNSCQHPSVLISDSSRSIVAEITHTVPQLSNLGVTDRNVRYRHTCIINSKSIILTPDLP